MVSANQASNNWPLAVRNIVCISGMTEPTALNWLLRFRSEVKSIFFLFLREHKCKCGRTGKLRGYRNTNRRQSCWRLQRSSHFNAVYFRLALPPVLSWSFHQLHASWNRQWELLVTSCVYLMSAFSECNIISHQRDSAI